MKNVFTIGERGAGCNILLFEIGGDYCCYALLKGDERTFQHISYVSFSEAETNDALAGILDELRNEACDRIIVCSAFAECLMLPPQYATAANTLLSHLFTEEAANSFFDTVPEWQITLGYQMPEAISNLIADRFPSAQTMHAYTPALKVYNGFNAADQINVHFTTGEFRVLVKKNSQVQLAQTYPYKTPLDVVYFLLKICYEFELQQSDVVVVLSGLIDQDSALYKELYNYFLNLAFAQAPAYAVPQNDHPQHYFTSLYNLAACVS